MLFCCIVGSLVVVSAHIRSDFEDGAWLGFWRSFWVRLRSDFLLFAAHDRAQPSPVGRQEQASRAHPQRSVQVRLVVGFCFRPHDLPLDSHARLYVHLPLHVLCLLCCHRIRRFLLGNWHVGHRMGHGCTSQTRARINLATLPFSGLI